MTALTTWLYNTLASLRKEEGQGMVEYGLILALIAVVVIAVLTLIGTDLISKFQLIEDAID
jgi:pilus assembly protein Flp/PilA